MSTTTKYLNILFIQGDEGASFCDLVAEFGPESVLNDMRDDVDPDDAGDIDPEDLRVSDSPAWTANEESVVDRDGYVLSWSYSRGYVGLSRMFAVSA